MPTYSGDKSLTDLSTDIENATKQGTSYLQQGNLEKAKEQFEHAYKISKELQLDFTTRACAFNVGAIYIALHEAEPGLNYLQQAIPPHNERDGKSNGDLYYNFGLGYEALKDDSEAVKYYELAYEEYQFERDNIYMEAEVANRAGTIYGRLQSPLQSARSYGISAKTYAILKDINKQALCLCQQALQFHHSRRIEEAVQTADDCLILCHNIQSQEVLGKLYNELGLIYTQCHEFTKAASCFEFALPIIRNTTKEKKCEAIILQNLGAVYNSVQDYQRALAFHEQAAAVYAEIGSRSCQGQCFINLAFAYSQLGDTETAGECYLHAVQAAKDGGDKRGQWQATEGLGAVYFNQGNVEKAIAYYQLTLKILTDSAEANQIAHERIIAKLSDALEYQASLKQKSPQPVAKSSRPSTAQSMQLVQTAYKPEIFIRPPTREEQRHMQSIRSQLMLKKVPNELGHIAHGIGDYNTDDDLSVASSKKDRKKSRPSSSNRPGSAKPKKSHDRTDSKMKAVGQVMPETIQEERSAPPPSLLSTGRRTSKQGMMISGLETGELNLQRRNKRPLLRPNKYNSELEWNEKVKAEVFSDDSIIRQCLPGHSGDEYDYKERLRPPSTDEEKDTQSEEETSTVSTSEKQRNQNRVKDILRGKAVQKKSKNRTNKTTDTDSDRDSPRHVGLRTSELPPPDFNGTKGGGRKRTENKSETSSSAGGREGENVDDDDDDDNTLVQTSTNGSRTGEEELYETEQDNLLVNQYKQRIRRLSMRDEDAEEDEIGSEEETSNEGDSETVNSEEFIKSKSPPVPAKSPPQTLKFSGTYEEPIPVQNQKSKDDNESSEETMSDSADNEQGGKTEILRHYNKGNYFRSETTSPERHGSDFKGSTLKETITDPNDPLYQTIRSVKEQTVQAVVEPPPREPVAGTSGLQQNLGPQLPPRPNQPLKMADLSRGEQEEYLRKLHMQSMNKANGSDEIVPLPIQREPKKDRKAKSKSQMCLLM